MRGRPLNVAMLTRSVVAALGLAAAIGLTSCSRSAAKSSAAGSGAQAVDPARRKVVVIGFDGMDPRMCQRLMDEGELSNLKAMADRGGYRPLGTSIPPQSPVAWSNFITGAGPGVHGIFDFVHRDPAKQIDAYYSAAKTIESEDGWVVGEHKLPLTFWPFGDKPTETVLMRRGTPFWDYLDRAGIAVRLYDIPSNYPPTLSSAGNAKCMSGMGVPDLMGTYGTYQYFSEDTTRVTREDGGIRRGLVFVKDRASGILEGPANSYADGRTVPSTVPFVIYRHPSEATARIEIQGQTVLLRQGEWSTWKRVVFDMDMPPFLPKAKANGICRFFLQEVRPNFRLFVSQIHIDPSDPAGQRVSEPEAFVTEIYDRLGLFPTAGFQEAYKALSNEVFNDAEYREQADNVLTERLRLLGFAREEYQGGLLFFYFSSTDLQAHMFWWDSDQPHPTRTPAEARRYHKVIQDLYRSMDGVVGEIVEQYGKDALVLVLSDHGFCNFKRQFHLNTWLRQEGYIKPDDCTSVADEKAAVAVDWSRTRAYGLGLNGLYLNLKGREKLGIVEPFEKEALLREISQKLLSVRDPVDGRPVIKYVYQTSEVYDGPEAANAPDLIVGYYRDFRASWATTLGEITDSILTDNHSAWSADHCIASDEVPGVLFSNRPITRTDPALIDLAPTILEEFGVARPEAMQGKSVFGE
ncbi:MAG: alkaline phosphatase family protein [Phycisphaerae bacterium]|nr:alkaline phosphatase family protein [Phycisphaerae bacterium]